jgi:hypothetical protein
VLQQRKVISKEESGHDLDSLLAAPKATFAKHSLQSDNTKYQHLGVTLRINLNITQVYNAF